MARTLRNEFSYDDWTYGTEPIPGDTAWVQPRNLQQLHQRLVQRFVEAETVNPAHLAALAIAELRQLPPPALGPLLHPDASLVQ